MKKYILRDSKGQKTTIFAKNITDALSYIEDSKRVNDFVVGNSEAYEWWSKHGKRNGYWDRDLILEWPLDTKGPATKYFNEMKSALPNVKMHLAKKSGRYVIVFDSKVKDEASSATTINALIEDEKSAIEAYNVAISNLENKLDAEAIQVLINIRNDERRHIENLYSILNDNITEKNLEDNKMKDTAAPGVDEKKFNRLVNYFDIWGKPTRRELQDVIDYYRLNSATAYQLLIYWGYKDEFKKLHFYDSLSKAVK